MTLQEVSEALGAGKKIRRASWGEAYVRAIPEGEWAVASFVFGERVVGGGFLAIVRVDKTAFPWTPTDDDRSAVDWLIEGEAPPTQGVFPSGFSEEHVHFQ